MFEISDLKAKKLPELQEIAKGLNVPKYKLQKKIDLVYQILDLQAANPKVVEAVTPSETPKVEKVEKPRPRPRAQIAKVEAKARNPRTERGRTSNNKGSGEQL